MCSLLSIVFEDTLISLLLTIESETRNSDACVPSSVQEPVKNATETQEALFSIKERSNTF